MKTLDVICFGEILWDVFPDGRTLGGAPLNVALRLKSLGASVKMISRLGTDPLADETRSLLETAAFDVSLIQEDDLLETGQVDVVLDDSGSASYTIKNPVAWDSIELTEKNKEEVSAADVFIFGSLAMRSQVSRSTLKLLLPLAKLAVFDVNLRPPHYQMNHLVQFMKQAQFIKMNEEELDEIAQYFKIKNSTIEDKLKELSLELGAQSICVTLGPAGAVLWQKDKLYSHPGFSVQVNDTVGAGDSFLAGLIFQLYQKKEHPHKALAFACALGSMVASKKGANPIIPMEEILAKIEE